MIDTHCHLEDFKDIEEVIKRMQNGYLIVSGDKGSSNQFVVDLVERYPNVYGTIGIHPENVATATDSDFTFLEKNLTHPKIVGVGEIGLDYHYTNENKPLQKQVFERQLEMAKKYNKTVVIHSRDAAEDTYNILRESNMHDTKMILHCYGYSLEMAERFSKFPVMFGIGGVVTFKNSIKLKDVVKNINIDKLLLETDSPYLSPEPYRGKRNEPANVLYVASKIAEIKNIPLEFVQKMTTENAIRQFDLPIIL